jgi:hypothetical protein
MAKHRAPRKPSTLTRAAGGGLVVGGLTLGAVALSTVATPAEANAACGSGLSAFDMTGLNNPNTVNLGSGNNVNFQGGFFGANLGGTQGSSTGNNGSTNIGNTTTCSDITTPSLIPSFPAFGLFSNTGTNNPNTFNVLSGNNVNVQFSPFGTNVGGAQSSSTGNNTSTNIGNITTTTVVH